MTETHYNAELDAKLSAIQDRKAEILADEQELYDAMGDYLEKDGVTAASELHAIANAKDTDEMAIAGIKLANFLCIVAEWYAEKEISNG